MIKEITSLTNPYIKSLEKLYDKKVRDNEKQYLIEGYHLVKEAINSHVLETVLISNNDDEVEGIENILVPYEIIKKLSKTKTPQGIIGVCKIKESSELLGDKVLLLDGVNDPGNLGTLIRSALGFNFNDIIISNNTVDVYNDKVLRSTQGAHFKVNIIRRDLIDAIKELKANNYMVIGTLDSQTDLQSIKIKTKYAVILGNEANGISPEVLKQTDVSVRIGMSDQLESLNVSVAGSIMMYYLNELK
jgi:TrmH family RNA methyltransferase